MLKYVLIILALLTVLAAGYFGLRGTSSRQPPIMVFDDMDDQPKYKNQSESSFFPDGRQLRPIPAGTVAWGPAAGQPDKSLLVDDLANFELKTIPVSIDAALMQHGQKVYATYCTICHGGFGNGGGVTTGYGMAPPANYHSDRLRQVTDGYLYKVITEGKGVMGPYGPSIRPDDRWAVVAYVRALQRAGDSKLDDVPANLRQSLDQK